LLLLSTPTFEKGRANCDKAIFYIKGNSLDIIYNYQKLFGSFFFIRGFDILILIIQIIIINEILLFLDLLSGN